MKNSSIFSWAFLIGLFIVGVMGIAGGGWRTAYAQSLAGTNINLDLTVMGCNNNGICEPWIGESSTTCPLDCTISTSTPPATSTPPFPTGGGAAPVSGGGGAFLIMKSILAVAGENSVTISWTTDLDSAFSFFWGKTTDYGLGSIGGTVYSPSHQIELDDLQPGTTYSFQIQMNDSKGDLLTYDGYFETQPLPPPAIMPPNVSNVRTMSDQSGITLMWTNPPTGTFSGVRIIRTPYPYPTDPNAGEIIYQGAGSYTLDQTAEPLRVYYYAIFTYDSDGNYSSGVLFSAVRPQKTFTPSPGGGLTSSSSAALPPSLALFPAPINNKFNMQDIVFVQDGHTIQFTGNSVPVDGGEPLTVEVPQSLFPYKLLFSGLSIMSETGTTTYLLQPDASSTVYSSVIDLSALYSEQYGMTFIFSPGIGTPYSVPGFLDVTARPIPSPTFSFLNRTMVTLYLILALILILLFLKRRRKEDQQ